MTTDDLPPSPAGPDGGPVVPGPGGTVVMGVDPGSLHAGYGLIAVGRESMRVVACGTVSPRATLPLAERLAVVHRAMLELVERHRPAAMALEDVFTHKNHRAALHLAQARAASILAGALRDVPVFEYAPSLVKIVVTGSGRADKTQVAYMVSKILGFSDPARSDTTDALAVAVCHAGQIGGLPGLPGDIGLTGRRRASSWRNVSPEGLEKLGHKLERN